MIPNTIVYVKAQIDLLHASENRLLTGAVDIGIIMYHVQAGCMVPTCDRSLLDTPEMRDGIFKTVSEYS